MIRARIPGGLFSGGGGGGASVTTSDTPPATPVDGDLWWDSVLGKLFVWFVDPDGGQWVPATPSGRGDGTSGMVHAVAYGVIANNPAVDVATNTANLQAALTAAAGNVLILPPGEIRVAGPTAGACLFAPSVGVTIRGAGRFATTLRNATGSATIAAVDADRIDIEGICFDGAQAGPLAWQTGVMFRGVVRGSIRDCRFTRLGNGATNCAKLGFGGSDSIAHGTRQCEMIDISHNLFESNFGSVGVITKYVGAKLLSVCDNTFNASNVTAISIESEGAIAGVEYADSIMVCRNNVRDCSWTYVTGGNISYGISISEQARRVVCDENIVNGIVANTLGAGIIINSSPGQSDTEVQRVSACNNVVTGVSATTGRGHGILLQTGDVDISKLAVNGNIIGTANMGLTFESAASTHTLGTITDLTVSGNVIADCSEIAIWHANTSGSGELAVERAVIGGNVCTGSGSHGMSLLLKNAVLDGNVVSNSTGAGIVLQAGSSDCLLIGNRCTANGQTGIQATGDRLSFIANQCNDNGQGGALSYGLYLVSGNDGQIVNNRCGDTQGSPTQDTGIRAPAGTLVQGNTATGNATTPYFTGAPFDAWIVTQNRPASIVIAADAAEHVVLTETVPQNKMARLGMALRVRVSYFGTWTVGNLVVRLKFAAATLATITLPPLPGSRAGVIIWEMGQNGAGVARCSENSREGAGATTTFADRQFDAAFVTSGGDQDVTVTMQLTNAADTATAAAFIVEHLGW